MSNFAKEQAGDLFSSVYEELRRIAAAQMNRLPPAGSTLQPTALVHEVWLRLGAGRLDWQSQAHFFAAAAEAMRHILIDRARQRRAIRHGGGVQRIALDEIEIPVDPDDDERLLVLDEAIEKLADSHPEIAMLAKLRCLAGFEVGEAAQMLGMPRATAYRKWLFARAWLHEELSPRLQNAQDA